MLHFQILLFTLVFNKENGSLLKIIAGMSRIAGTSENAYSVWPCDRLSIYSDMPNCSTSIPQSVASHSLLSKMFKK